MADTVTTIGAQAAIDAGSLANSTTRGNIRIPVDDYNLGSANKTRRVTFEQIVEVAVDEAVDAMGGSGGGAVQIATIAALRAMSDTPDEVYVQGHTTALDGGQGLFRLLAASGRTAGDIDSSGEDDNGWHIVCTSTGAMYGRDDRVATPEHFGVVGSVSAVAAATASDQTAAMQRWLNMWANPAAFPGINTVRGMAKWIKPRFEAHALFYRCSSMLTVEVPLGNPAWYGGPNSSELIFHGSVFKLYTENFPSFRVITWRNSNCPKMRLRYYKQLNSSKTGWNATTYPQRYRDPASYRVWQASTEFFRDEEIKYTISGVTYLYVVTQSGTTDGTVPTTSTSEQTSGTCKFTRLGSITTSDGKWMRDHICESRDIGVWCDQLENTHNLEIDGENTLIGILVCPRGGSSNSCGFSTIHARYLLGSKFPIVIANHVFDYLVETATARKALTGVPPLAVVRQTTDATYDYVFTGAAGTESSDGSWTQRAARTTMGWCNDLRFKVDLTYGRGNSVIDTTQSTYGAVQTVFGFLYLESGKKDFSVSVGSSTSVITATDSGGTPAAHGFTKNDEVYLTTTSALPTGLSASQRYRVLSQSTLAGETQFTLRTAPDLTSPATFSTDGVGDHYVQKISAVGPSGNFIDDIGLEFLELPSGNVEMVMMMYDSGDEGSVRCRNDNANRGSAAIHLRHVNRNESPKYNETRTIRAGRRLNLTTWQNDRNNGCLNRVIESPYISDRIVEYNVQDLMEDALFSGKDRVYFRRSGIWHSSETTHRQYATYRTAADANTIVFNAATRSFDVPYQHCFAVIVEIPVNHTGQAILEVESCHASVGSDLNNDGRVSVSIYNPTTGTGFVDQNQWPFYPIDGSVTMFPTNSGSHYWSWLGTDRSDPICLCFQPWVRKILVRIHGKKMTGYRLRLHNAPNARMCAPGKANGRPDAYVAAKPERGIWQAPTRLLYDGVSANVMELNKAAGGTEYWAVSDTVANLVGTEVAYQWAHTGTTIYERDSTNTTWNTIATGVTAILPADWQDI